MWVSDHPPTWRIQQIVDSVSWYEGFSITVTLLTLYGVAGWFIMNAPVGEPAGLIQSLQDCHGPGCEVNRSRD